MDILININIPMVTLDIITIDNREGCKVYIGECNFNSNSNHIHVSHNTEIFLFRPTPYVNSLIKLVKSSILFLKKMRGETEDIVTTIP